MGQIQTTESAGICARIPRDHITDKHTFTQQRQVKMCNNVAKVNISPIMTVQCDVHSVRHATDPTQGGNVRDELELSSLR